MIGAFGLSIWRSCAGPSLTSRGAVTSTVQRVDFRSHLAITYQRTEDEPFLMLVHLPGLDWTLDCSLPEHLQASDLTLKTALGTR